MIELFQPKVIVPVGARLVLGEPIDESVPARHPRKSPHGKGILAAMRLKIAAAEGTFTSKDFGIDSTLASAYLGRLEKRGEIKFVRREYPVSAARPTNVYAKPMFHVAPTALFSSIYQKPLQPDIQRDERNNRIGEFHTNAKISDEGVKEAVRLYREEDWTIGRIARAFNVSARGVKHWINGTTRA